MLCEKKLIKRLNREYDRVPFSRKNSVSRQIVPLQMDFQTSSKYVQVYCVYEQKNSFSERNNCGGGVFSFLVCSVPAYSQDQDEEVTVNVNVAFPESLDINTVDTAKLVDLVESSLTANLMFGGRVMVSQRMLSNWIGGLMFTLPVEMRAAL